MSTQPINFNGISAISRDAMSLKIHIDNLGKVWFINGNETINNSGQDMNAFMQSDVYKDAKIFRLVGSRNNAKLIVQLYSKKKAKTLKKVEVCSPACNIDVSDPTTVLMNMRRWSYPTSVGGWHEVNEQDFAMYILIHALQRMKNIPDDNIRQLVLNHPAWRSLSFIGTLNIDCIAVLLSLIIDPRWFVDVDEPSSGSRLKAFLGLNPKIQSLVSSSRIPSNSNDIKHYDRCALVLNTWKNSDKPPKDAQLPNHFLWRFWLNKSNDPVASDLRTSQYFISYLRHTWIAALYGGKQAGEDLFVPEIFFHEEIDTNGYKQHMT